MAENNEKKCPKCGSEKIKSKRSWSSVFFWAAIFALAVIVALVAEDDRLNAGAQALAILLVVPLIAFALIAKFGVNRCLDCQHHWG